MKSRRLCNIASGPIPASSQLSGKSSKIQQIRTEIPGKVSFTLAMYHESDPLLPKDEPAPEIHGSRPQSINDINDRRKTDDYLGVEADKVVNSRKGLGDVAALFVGFIIVASCALVLFSDGVHRIGDILNPTPRTIDQRVARILRDTPLIGSLILSIFCISRELILKRWTR